jgi:hypothetical protein
MPCVVLNSYSLTPSIVPGDAEIGTGISNQRNMPVNFYYNYSYSGMMLKASQLSAIPSGATIDRIEFKYEILTNGTYDRTDVNMYMYQVDATYSAFPSNTRVNGYSQSDLTYNSSITNYKQTLTNSSYDLIKISSDPNITFRGIDLQTPYTGFDNTKNLVIIFNNLSGFYVPGSQSYPRVKGTTLNNGGTCYFDYRDSSAYALTDFVNIQLSFMPIIKLYWS